MEGGRRGWKWKNGWMEEWMDGRWALIDSLDFFEQKVTKGTKAEDEAKIRGDGWKSWEIESGHSLERG